MGCRGWTSDKPPVHANPNMDTQEKFKPFRESSFFKDQRSMRPYVKGTVPRTLAGNVRADKDILGGDTPEFTGKEGKDYILGLPAGYSENDKQLLALGDKSFGIYCAPCHGKAGDGKSPIARRFPVPPPSFHQTRLHAMPLGKIYAAITHGVNKPNMPSYAAQMPVRDRWATVAYLRKIMMAKESSLSFLVDPSIGELKVADDADPKVALGAKLYTSKTCNACHSIDGVKGVGPSFKGIIGRTVKGADGERVSDAAYIKESIKEPNKFIVDGFPPAMPPLGLSDEEIDQIIAWMETLK